MGSEAAEDVTLWTIAYARSPNPTGEPASLLSAPFSWDEGETVRAAVLAYESPELAEIGLRHYLARTGQDGRGYGLMAFQASELAGILEEGPEGFDRVAVNPILSIHFPDAEGYAATLGKEELAARFGRWPEPRRTPARRILSRPGAPATGGSGRARRPRRPGP